MSALTVNIERKAYLSREGARLAIAGLTFALQDGELVCVLGPSGAGKTTMLNIIAGLDASFQGEVSFREAKPHRLSYVFQDPRLLPWRTLIENVALPLKGKADAPAIAASWLDRVGLSGCHNLYPGQASIGMQRRASLARAFAFGPTVLLMDEPFVSLDEKAAQELRSLFKALWQAQSVTTLFVTHNVAEAAQLATRVLIFTGSPARIAADVDMRREGDSRDGAELLLRSALDAAQAGSASI